MALPTQNEFTSYDLSKRELLEGAILSSLQEQVFQNERANIAAQILALEFTPSNPMKFTQQDSFLKGQLSILTGLIEASKAAKTTLLQGNNHEL